MPQAHERAPTAIHVLSLHAGDKFTFNPSPGATVFTIVEGPDDRLWVKAEGSALPRHALEVGGCFVYPVDDERSEGRP
jgi:streptogramin lyase